MTTFVIPSSTDEVYGHYTHDERRKIGALQRRAAWLEQRVANYKPTGNPSHDAAELSAIKWALSIIANTAPVSDAPAKQD